MIVALDLRGSVDFPELEKELNALGYRHMGFGRADPRTLIVYTPDVYTCYSVPASVLKYEVLASSSSELLDLLKLSML